MFLTAVSLELDRTIKNVSSDVVGLSLNHIFRNDSTFLISKMTLRTSWYNYETRYKIFGISETKTVLKLKFFGEFGLPTFAERLTFPQVITRMKNGKYLFYPQSFIRSDSKEKILTIDVEEWEGDKDWTRSSVNFLVNFNAEREKLWIFKV